MSVGAASGGQRGGANLWPRRKRKGASASAGSRESAPPAAFRKPRTQARRGAGGRSEASRPRRVRRRTTQRARKRHHDERHARVRRQHGRERIAIPFQEHTRRARPVTPVASRDASDVVARDPRENASRTSTTKVYRGSGNVLRRTSTGTRCTGYRRGFASLASTLACILVERLVALYVFVVDPPVSLECGALLSPVVASPPPAIEDHGCATAGLSRNTASVPTCSTLSNNRAAALAYILRRSPGTGSFASRSWFHLAPRPGVLSHACVVVGARARGVASSIRQRRPRAPRSETTVDEHHVVRRGCESTGAVACTAASPRRRRPETFSRDPASPIRRARRPGRGRRAPTRRRRACTASRATRESRRTETRRALRCAPARRRVPNALVDPPPPHSRYFASPSFHVAPSNLARTYLSTVSRSLALIAGACAGSCAHAAGRVLAGTTSPRLDLGTTPRLCAALKSRIPRLRSSGGPTSANANAISAAPTTMSATPRPTRASGGPSRGGTPSGEPTPILAGARCDVVNLVAFDVEQHAPRRSVS